jgi:hypothetical protein
MQYSNPTPIHIRELCNRYCSQFQEIKNQNFKLIHPSLIDRALEWQKQNSLINNETIKTEKYMKQDDDILIKDTNKEYKIVSKNYYLYYMKETEFDTEEELVDEDDWEEEKRIKAKYV